MRRKGTAHSSKTSVSTFDLNSVNTRKTIIWAIPIMKAKKIWFFKFSCLLIYRASHSYFNLFPLYDSCHWCFVTYEACICQEFGANLSSAVCLIYFTERTWRTDLDLLKRLCIVCKYILAHIGALALKWWQLLFKNFFSGVLTNIGCLIFFLLHWLPWIMVSWLILHNGQNLSRWKTQSLWFLTHCTLRSYKGHFAHCI